MSSTLYASFFFLANYLFNFLLTSDYSGKLIVINRVSLVYVMYSLSPLQVLIQFDVILFISFIF